MSPKDLLVVALITAAVMHKAYGSNFFAYTNARQGPGLSGPNANAASAGVAAEAQTKLTKEMLELCRLLYDKSNNEVTKRDGQIDDICRPLLRQHREYLKQELKRAQEFMLD